MAAQLQEVEPKWLEEPVWPAENYDGLAEVRRTGGVAIAAGENVSTLLDFGRLLDAGAVDFVQPSPAKMGGITELRKVYTAAALRSVTVMLHSFYDGPGLLAAIHATAALGTADSMIEWHYLGLEAQSFGDDLTVKNGRVLVPQCPGLGIDPDPDVQRLPAEKLGRAHPVGPDEPVKRLYYANDGFRWPSSNIRIRLMLLLVADTPGDVSLVWWAAWGSPSRFRRQNLRRPRLASGPAKRVPLTLRRCRGEAASCPQLSPR